MRVSLSFSGFKTRRLAGMAATLHVPGREVAKTVLLIMWHNQQLTRRKAIVLCALYGVFVLYAVAGSLGYGIENIFG